MAKYKTFAQVQKRKDGSGTYIKITEDITLKKGQIVNVDDPRTKPSELLALGIISEEVAAKMQARADKTPDFVLKELTVKE